MPSDKPVEVTPLLMAWRLGDAAALDRLMTRVYDELRRLVRRYMRDERAGITLQTTALVNEVYLRLVDLKSVGVEERGQFLSICAQVMRRILVDAARARSAQKRGGGAVKVDLDDEALPVPSTAESVLAQDEALAAFAQLAPRPAKIIELRYFGGLNEQQTAEALGVWQRSARRDWRLAHAWLRSEMAK